MNSIEKAEQYLNNEISVSQVRATSVNENDYKASLAGFLYFDGRLNDAFELLEGVENDPLADFLKACCRHGREGWNDEVKKLVEQFNAEGNPIAGKLLAINDESIDDVTTVSLLRRAAFTGDRQAILKMADICHDGNVKKGLSLFYVARGSADWQDRKQEYWWRELHIRCLVSANYPVMYHAFNQIEQSYGRSFPSNEINETLFIAAALGSDQAVDHLIGFFTNDMHNLEKLKKSLFWLYYKKEKSGLSRQETALLEKVEERICS